MREMLVHFITLKSPVMNTCSLGDAETPGVLTDTGQSANTGKEENVQKKTNANLFTIKDQVEIKATEVMTEAEDTVTTAEASLEDTAVVTVERTAAARMTAVKWRISKFDDTEYGCNATVLHSYN